MAGGERGIRTLDTDLSPYASLAGKCLRPLGQLSVLMRLLRGRNNTRLHLKNQSKLMNIMAKKLVFVHLLSIGDIKWHQFANETVSGKFE